MIPCRYSKTEGEALKLLLDPAFLKFTFVRHPLSRLVSVFLNKHVSWKDPGMRAHWNNVSGEECVGCDCSVLWSDSALVPTNATLVVVG